ncbi:bifunctional 3-phosphoshikimate 1-carboxyvinyltransferase/cytidylate kinase [Ideonella paludis]|uniref:Multifunctional fusion protein n=1 Tax=Ideonella paludis TaxID=1233411 RepID=A0ABS5DVJ9_9BURK|nr:bifunctional 3-phosphoshikimate 1-carboxyvinyltransferase/cytidylate kinase [Ideonella paludis]MBQ0935171.1 bifunctional 3-phosphoshikimate 1-carboxyvinyltransferase/cytidylate kinase [Ideonella paludis]
MYTTAFLDLPPLTAAAGTVRLPGSKSISNRVLLLAGLAQGTTDVHDLLDSDDTRVMLAALEALGCTLERLPGVLRVTGLGGQLKVKQADLFLGNAGTAMRPLTAALAVLAATQGGAFKLSGVARMHERPIGDLVEALRQLGCPVTDLGQAGFPPLQVGSGTPTRLDTQTPIRVRGDVSSQFLTALLLALPLVSHDGPVTIEVQGELISKPYIDITLRLLERFGIAVQRDGYQRFVIPQCSAYQTPGRIHVEGDASSASYFVALGALAATEQPVRIEGVGLEAIQGDIRFVEAAEAMGAQVQGGEGWLEVKRGRWPLKGIQLDCNHIPDAAMTLAVMALYADSPTRLSNIASWRVKETDRIAAMACELRKLGAEVIEGPDFIEVAPLHQWQSASIHTYDDHRMAMCLSLAALNPLAGAKTGVTVRIEDPKCVAKTFPDYFETLFSVVTAAPGAIPVLAVDGPTASGKGTLAAELAKALGYHLLDSGALYRATALAARNAGVALSDGPNVARIAARLDIRFDGESVWMAGQEVSHELRLESTGGLASQVSVHPEVRQALHELQLSFQRLPGLVADGRDMGTVVFPQAQLKVFLTASAEKRAERRYKQLIAKGISANIDSLLLDLQARDERDKSRAAAPLKPAEDALLLDNSELSIESSVEQVLGWWEQRKAPTAAN